MYHYLSNLSSILKINKLVKVKIIYIIPLFKLEQLTLKGCKFDIYKKDLKFNGLISNSNYAFYKTVRIYYKKGVVIIFISHNK